MTSGGLNDKTRDKVGAFLDGFDGDAVKAAQALRDYANELRSSKINRPKDQGSPTGKALLAAKDIRKTYKLGRQKLEVLRGIDLTQFATCATTHKLNQYDMIGLYEWAIN